MKKAVLFILVSVVISHYSSFSQNQPKGKEKLPSQKEMEEMMKAAQKAMENISGEDKSAMQDFLSASKTNHSTPGLPAPLIPPLRSNYLAAIKPINNSAELSGYISILEIKAKSQLPKALISEIEVLWQQTEGKLSAQINIPTALLLQKNPGGAVYSAILLAKAHPASVLALSNFAAILQQTGSPHLGLPVLQFLLKSNKDKPTLYNNTGQCYFSLGDTAKARANLQTCLALEPDHPEANLTMGIVLTGAKKYREASPYILKALKHGYSPTAEALAEKAGIKPKLKDVERPDFPLPSNFKPNEYKPIMAAASFQQRDSIFEARHFFSDQIQPIKNKFEQIKTEAGNKFDAQGLEGIQKSGATTASKDLPFAEKARFMLALNREEFATQIQPIDAKWQTMAIKHTTMYVNLQQALKNIPADKCDARNELVNKYLNETAPDCNWYSKEYSKVYGEYIQKDLLWMGLSTSEDFYRYYSSTKIVDFLTKMLELSTLQRLEHAAYHCKPNDIDYSYEDTIPAIEENWCPIKLAIPLVFGKIKMDCKTFECEGGEFVKFGFEHDFKTGEYTLSAGFGLGLETGVLDAGATDKFFIKFDKKQQPIDFGIKMEMGAELTGGIVNTEAKYVHVMTVEGGVNTSINALGKEFNFYE